MRYYLLILVVLVAPILYFWERPQGLSVPVGCAVGKECFIQNYFDHDNGGEYLNYACDLFTYDGHDGTDFRVKTLADMEAGVTVLAAANGTVSSMRDGMEDISVKEGGREAVKDRECGNGVVLAHGKGLETQYCHMKKGSVRVKPGDTVRAGQALGLIGMSGLTEFPHLHFGVRLHGEEVDPFTGITERPGCGAMGKPLWSAEARAQLAYAPTQVLGSGFLSAIPDDKAARAGEYRDTVVSKNGKVLIFWVDAMGIKQGDKLAMYVLRPDGNILAQHVETLPRAKAQLFYFVGARLPEGTYAWPSGEYKGVYQIIRQRGDEVETVIDHREKVTVF